MRAGPSLSDRRTGCMLPCHDQADNVSAGRDRRDRFKSVRQELKGMFLVIFGQFNESAFLQGIEQAVHDLTRSCVRVPVLSVHSTSIAPKFWMDGSRLTTTFFLAMVSAPFARFTVTIMGSISGVRPTAMERPNRRASTTQSPLVIPTMKYTAQTMTTINRIMSQVKERTPLSKLVSSRRSASRSAMDPKSVRVPVFITTPRAVPLVTLLPRKQAFDNSHALCLQLIELRLFSRQPWTLP